MINLQFAELMYKYSNQMLPEHFCDYFTKLNNVHQLNTRQNYSNDRVISILHFDRTGKKTLHHIQGRIQKVLVGGM